MLHNGIKWQHHVMVSYQRRTNHQAVFMQRAEESSLRCLDKDVKKTEVVLVILMVWFIKRLIFAFCSGNTVDWGVGTSWKRQRPSEMAVLVLICSDISLLGDRQTEPKRLLLQLNNRLKYPKKIETIHCFISTSCFLASAHLRVRSPESDLMHAAVHQRHQIIACLCTY